MSLEGNIGGSSEVNASLSANGKIHGKLGLPDMIRGYSAYEVAIINGFNGTEEEWLASLNGGKGDTGESAYEIAVKNGFVGTEEEWLESLHGENVETDETLIMENGVLRVNTADEVSDSTLPITAAAVNVTVGNIEALLETI